jgi:hypothetical protein
MKKRAPRLRPGQAGDDQQQVREKFGINRSGESNSEGAERQGIAGKSSENAGIVALFCGY